MSNIFCTTPSSIVAARSKHHTQLLMEQHCMIAQKVLDKIRLNLDAVKCFGADELNECDLVTYHTLNLFVCLFVFIVAN